MASSHQHENHTKLPGAWPPPPARTPSHTKPPPYSTQHRAAPTAHLQHGTRTPQQHSYHAQHCFMCRNNHALRHTVPKHAHQPWLTMPSTGPTGGCGQEGLIRGNLCRPSHMPLFMPPACPRLSTHHRSKRRTGGTGGEQAEYGSV
jgi:hypothetical protein